MGFLDQVSEAVNPVNLLRKAANYSKNVVSGECQGVRQATLGTLGEAFRGIGAAVKEGVGGVWRFLGSGAKAVGSTVLLPALVVKAPFKPEEHIGKPFGFAGEAVQEIGSAIIQPPNALIQAVLGSVHSVLLGGTRMAHALSGVDRETWEEATAQSTVRSLAEDWLKETKINFDFEQFNQGESYLGKVWNGLKGGLYSTFMVPFFGAINDIKEYVTVEFGRRAEPPLRLLRAIESLLKLKPFESYHHIFAGIKFLMDKVKRFQMEAAVPFNFLERLKDGLGKSIAAFSGRGNKDFMERTGLKDDPLYQ